MILDQLDNCKNNQISYIGSLKHLFPHETTITEYSLFIQRQMVWCLFEHQGFLGQLELFNKQDLTYVNLCWIIKTELRFWACVNVHTEESFRNLIKSNRNQIAFTIFRLIWNQTDIRLDPNKSENGKYNLFSGWFNKISEIFVWVKELFKN